MSADEMLVKLRDDESGLMITPEIFPEVVELWQAGLVVIEAGQDGELYIRLK